MVQGTTLAQNAATYIDQHFTGHSFQVVKKRKIAGSDKWSEHTYGNALDVFADTETMARIALALNENRRQLKIATLCFDGPGGPYDGCTTPHNDHIHVSFTPKCGDTVSPSGTDAQRIQACDNYQKGLTPEGEDKPRGPGDPGLPNPLEGITEGIQEIGQRALVVIAGLAAGGVAVALIAADMNVSKLPGAIGALGKVIRR